MDIDRFFYCEIVKSIWQNELFPPELMYSDSFLGSVKIEEEEKSSNLQNILKVVTTS